MDEMGGPRWSNACLRISLIVFVVMTAGVLSGLSDGLDASIRSAVHSWASPELTGLSLAFSRIGSVAVVYSLTVIVAAALLLLSDRMAALRLIALMAAAAVVNNGIKVFIARARPEAFFGVLPESYSFASGHALFSGCFYGFIGTLIASRLPDLWQRAAVLAATAMLVGTIGLSRVYLGVHYPTDVIAGFALAGTLLCVAWALLPEPSR